jgi:excisionase family DNA binding protein
MTKPKPKPATLPPELISLQAAAARVDVHVDTIRRQITLGRLTGYKLGERVMRVDPNEVAGLFRPTRKADAS